MDDTMVCSRKETAFRRFGKSFQSINQVWTENLTPKISIFHRPVKIHGSYIHAERWPAIVYTTERKAWCSYWGKAIKSDCRSFWSMVNLCHDVSNILESTSYQLIRYRKEKQISLDRRMSNITWTYQKVTDYPTSIMHADGKWYMSLESGTPKQQQEASYFRFSKVNRYLLVTTQKITTGSTQTWLYSARIDRYSLQHT